MTGTDSESTDDLAYDKQWCQYLTPTLPAEATGWWVTSVEFYCMKSSGGRDFDIRIFEPESNNWPSDTVIDESSFDSNDYSPQWAWNVFDFSGTYSLDPNEEICLAVMMSEAKKTTISIAYLSGAVSEADSALIQGDLDWKSYDTDKSLRYRVHGVYTTSSGGVSVVAGTWARDAAL